MLEMSSLPKCGKSRENPTTAEILEIAMAHGAPASKTIELTPYPFFCCGELLSLA